jgi:DnaJ-class molecular chaperone
MNRTTGAQRYNKRMENLFENAMRLRDERDGVCTHCHGEGQALFDFGKCPKCKGIGK